MRLAFSSNAFARYTLPETIGILADIGYDGIEVMADIPHAYPPEMTARRLAPVLEALSRHRMTVSNVNAFTLHAEGDTWNPSWIDPDPARRERRVRHTLDCINLASILGCRTISTEPGGPMTGMGRDEALDLFRHGLRQVEGAARARGVRILIEPEPDLLIETSSQFSTFFRSLDPAVFGLNFDIGHFFCVGEDPAEAARQLGYAVGHVHLEDIDNSRRHVHLLPGDGAIALNQVLDTLDQEGYDGFITVELYTWQDRPVEAAERSFQYLAERFKPHARPVHHQMMDHLPNIAH